MLTCFARCHAEYPEVWSLTDDDDDNDEDEDEEEEEEADDGAAIKVYPTFEAFLAFLESSCRGSAAQSYPLLVLLLSTLPTPVSTERVSCSELPQTYPLDLPLLCRSSL